MVTISLKLPKGLLQQIEQAARGRRASKSKIIRDCIERSLQRKKGGVFFDLAKDLAGVGRGPKDLATNRRYLDDLGK